MSELGLFPSHALPHPPMTLAELTTEETRLLAEVASVTGLMEDMMAELKRRDVYDAYARVHAAYADLAIRGDDEALKRALFLRWYSFIEPSCFTGLYDLTPEAEQVVLARLDALASTDRLDEEMGWMLPWYHRFTDHIFGTADDFRSLHRWLNHHKHERPPAEHVRSPSLDGRGQMSEYWYQPDYDERDWYGDYAS